MKLNPKGLISAPHTPMHSDGAINPGAIAGQAQWLVRSGVTGAFVNGTTGEWSSLTTDERIRLQAAWAAVDQPLLRIAHVGHLCQQDAVALAQHAGQVGLEAVAAVAPSFLKPGSAQALAEFFAPIAAAAPGLPFYVYHIPGLSGVTLPPWEQIEACAARIATFAGIKFTDPDLFAYARCVKQFGDRFDLMWGVDEILMGALGYGATSAVGSTYNYAAPLYLDMMRAHRRGDAERAQHQAQRAVQLVELLLEFGVLAAGKALMKLRGVDCGPVRLPVETLSDQRQQALFDRVQEAGLLDPVAEILVSEPPAPRRAATTS